MQIAGLLFVHLSLLKMKDKLYCISFIALALHCIAISCLAFDQITSRDATHTDKNQSKSVCYEGVQIYNILPPELEMSPHLQDSTTDVMALISISRILYIYTYIHIHLPHKNIAPPYQNGGTTAK